MKIALPFGLIGIGVLSLVASAVWPTVFPSSSFWKEADEQHLEEIQSKVHNLSYLVAQAERQPDPRKNRMSGESMQEYRELRAEAELLLAERDAAISTPGTISAWLRWGGIGSLFLGIVGYYVVRES